jgi:DNA-binding beta-propeller fold protein YncE
MKYILSLVVGLICTSVVQAEVIVANNPVIDTVGFYSDAFDSKGAYTYAQSGAQNFSLEDSYSTSSIRWWGSMNGFNDQGLTNIDCFQIIVWNTDKYWGI